MREQIVFRLAAVLKDQGGAMMVIPGFKLIGSIKLLHSR